MRFWNDRAGLMVGSLIVVAWENAGAAWGISLHDFSHPDRVIPWLAPYFNPGAYIGLAIGALIGFATSSSHHQRHGPSMLGGALGGFAIGSALFLAGKWGFPLIARDMGFH